MTARFSLQSEIDKPKEQKMTLAIKPGTNEIYIVTNDTSGGQGTTIFRAKVFAPALRFYSHQRRQAHWRINP